MTVVDPNPVVEPVETPVIEPVETEPVEPVETQAVVEPVETKPVETPVVRLGDVASFIRGITFKPTDLELANGENIDCMRTKNVQSLLDTTDVWSVPRSFMKRADQQLQVGDILISSANSWNLVGKACWIPELQRPATFGGFVTVLRAFPSAVDPRYLYRWFTSDPIQETLRSFGNQTTNISNLNLKRASQLQIPLPPLPDQRRIAAILDKADHLRTQRREALVHLDALTQSIFHSMFGDPVQNELGYETVPLSEIGHLYSGGTPSKSEPSLWDGNVPWFSPKDIKSTHLTDSIDHIAEYALQNSSLRLLPEGTIVVTGQVL
ncbi:restriction endonuclease subunit S [Specibacter cremeus]|uniref:restriction endonuclease subunit S n=1 Tax=Specibacter cremeus TaxID=1629051 RepID=UPI00197C7335|nr:restriction endonuclease subunit S [Specibacter cremeus]